MKKESIIHLFKKHYLLLSFTLVAFLVLVWAGVTRGFRPVLSTPIAAIEPNDSSLAIIASSKLESYLEELKPKPSYRAAREEVMSMDFSKRYDSKPKDNIKPGQTERKDSSELKAKKLPIVEQTNKAKPHHQSAKRPVQKDKPTQDKSGQMTTSTNGFHTIKAEKEAQEKASIQQQLVKAVIEGDHTLKPGATLRLRLKEKAAWKGETFPKNTLLHGTIGSGSSGRLKIRIMRIGETPLSLSVYDQDLQEGIVYQMQEPVNEALKESSTEALNEVFYSMPYGGVAGGIARLGRNLFGKIGTGRKGHIYLADGYEVFIGMSQ